MRKKFSENIYAEIQRIKQNGARKPLRTITEMAEEFGVSRPALSAYMRNDDTAPKQELMCKGASAQNTWYEPIAMRKWWKGRKS